MRALRRGLKDLWAWAKAHRRLSVGLAVVVSGAVVVGLDASRFGGTPVGQALIFLFKGLGALVGAA